MRKRRRYPNKFKMMAATFFAAVVLLFTTGFYAVLSNGAMPAIRLDLPSLTSAQWKDILFSGIPGLNNSPSQQPVKISPQITPQSFLRSMVMLVASIDIGDSKTWFRAEIPLLATIKQTAPPAVSAMTLPNFPKFDPKSLLPGGKPLVAVYHTHTAESFLPSSGVTHRPGGQRGEIVEVGEALVKRLEERGIKAVQSQNIHDYPSFMKAYGPSEATAKALLSENPSIQMIFDIHRDADKRENSLITINGVQLAKISIVVAKGQTDLTQPYWEQNYAFAKLIDAKLNQYFPGLSRGIHLENWRYNQHLHPRALLLEVGCQENSKEEAMRSVQLIGDILAEIVAEGKNEFGN